ncbi:hypothetical protein E6R18_15820 [Streptomyces sp. A1277]|uniref:hypothetical protein n=1 Tax=Streptomyces sp. A1277 TaxID=2563103 RepID=UPI0010A20F00|nr:hypothetical protein [Streptomyces sp. A1277]THA31796.1 hypothetical protein E6R18_15820 [Streptomyces sp. A1277]
MPSLPPPRTTELYYDGAWHDISGDMRESAPVRITRGVTGLGARQDPTAATATLDNRSGNYSPRNPLSGLFGKIGRNTPWRFSVNAGGLRLALPSSAYTLSTPDAATLDITGDIDVRIDVAPDTWASGQMLACRYSVGGNFAWALELTPAGRLIFVWTPTGLAANQRYAVSTVPVAVGRRRRVRATLDVDNGAGGCTVTFYVASGTGGWTQLGTPVVSTGTTSIYNPTAALNIGDPVAIAVTPEGDALGRLRGSVYGLQVYAGVNGALRVDVDPAAQGTAGASTFTDGTGLVWSLTGGAALSNRHVRMVGEIPAWPPSRDLSGADRTVQIAPAGIMRRLGAGNRPLDSALRRFILGARPVECWPLTDGEQATRGSSLFGSPPAAALNDQPPSWGKGSVTSWLEPTVLCPAGEPFALEGRPRTSGATNSWSVDFVRSGGAGFTALTIVDSGRGTDDSPQTLWQVSFISALDQITVGREVRVSDSSTFSTLASITPMGIFNASPHHIRLSTSVGSSSTAWVLYVDGVIVGSGSESGLGRPVGRLIIAGNAGDADLSLGYFTVWTSSAPTAAAMVQALQGFPGEAAGARALRISAENGVPIALAGVAADSTPLGVQEPQRYLEALDTIAAADLGLVLEQRDALALVYRARTTLYNQAPVLELDFANGEISAPFDPIDDDKLTQNDVTVRRRGGASSVPAVREDGPLSVDAIGRYDVAVDLSLAVDEQVTQQAWWRLHIGTFDGLRYTKITVSLANPRAYAKVHDALAVDVGDLIRLQNLPPDQRPGDVDLLVIGYDEEVGATAWTITYTCVPGEPWSVGVVDDAAPGRADTAGSELAAPVSATATVLPVVTTAGPVWVGTAAYPDEFPFDVTIDGEQVTVTAITGVAEDRFARTVSGGWGTADSGQAWTVADGPAADWSVSGGAGRCTISTANAFRIIAAPVAVPDVDLQFDFALSALPVGDSVYVFPTIRYLDGTHLYMGRVQITTAGSMVLSLRRRSGAESQIGSTYTTGYTYAPGAWYTARVAMTGSTLAGKVWPRGGVEPDWQLTVSDTTLTAPGSVAVRALLGQNVSNAPVTLQIDNLWCGPQQMTVIRSVNGVVKDQVAGADVRLTHPMIIAL